MGADAVRTGAPIQATVTTTGVEGTSDQVWTFQHGDRQAAVRPCIVANDSGATIYVMVNDEPATAADYHLQIANGAFLDVSFGGIVAVEKVSAYVAGGSDYDGVLVHGWAP